MSHLELHRKVKKFLHFLSILQFFIRFTYPSLTWMVLSKCPRNSGVVLNRITRSASTHVCFLGGFPKMQNRKIRRKHCGEVLDSDGRRYGAGRGEGVDPWEKLGSTLISGPEAQNKVVKKIIEKS